MQASTLSEEISFVPVEGPGVGVAELRRYLSCQAEWIHELVPAQKLGQMAHDFGMENFSGDDVLGLWHIGLLRADYVKGAQGIHRKGLTSLDSESLYMDMRAMEPKPEGYGGTMPERSREMPSYKDSLPELLFHPSRIYVLHHVARTFSSKTSVCQYLLWKPGIERLARSQVEGSDRWTSSPEFSDRFDYWNQVAEAAFLCKAVLWMPPKGHPASATVSPWLPRYTEMIRDHLKRAGLSMVRQYREDLAWAAHISDPNKTVQTLLRLMRPTERERVKGHLGAATRFLDMAESIRRASERLLGVVLPEEDELGPGQWMEGARKSLYGSERVFDAPRKDLRDFLGIVGLDFGVKVHCYVEGETELGAMRQAVGADGLCSFVNLKGSVVQKGGKGVAFADSLAEDARDRVISFVMIDSDQEEVVRTLKRAASDRRMHGPFFLNQPDFELANFTIEELLRVALATSLAVRFEDAEIDGQIPSVLPQIASAKSGKEFFSLLRQAGVDGVSKGEKWGEALMNYAIKHPVFPEKDPRAGKERGVIDAARTLIRAQSVGYLRSVDFEVIDPQTGKMVQRQDRS